MGGSHTSIDPRLPDCILQYTTVVIYLIAKHPFEVKKSKACSRKLLVVFSRKLVGVCQS